MPGELKYCGKCHMNTAHVDDACRRCEFLKKNGVKKPMSNATKEHLKRLNDWRKGKTTIDPRTFTAACQAGNCGTCDGGFNRSCEHPCHIHPFTDNDPERTAAWEQLKRQETN